MTSLTGEVRLRLHSKTCSIQGGGAVLALLVGDNPILFKKIRLWGILYYNYIEGFKKIKRMLSIQASIFGIPASICASKGALYYENPPLYS